MQFRAVLKSAAVATGSLARSGGPCRQLRVAHLVYQRRAQQFLSSAPSLIPFASSQNRQQCRVAPGDRAGTGLSSHLSPDGRPSNDRSHWVSLSRGMATDHGEGGDAAAPTSEIKGLQTPQEVIDFWFGDQERFERDKEYGQSRLGKWFGFGPEDDRFLETQHASKELIVKAARGELEGDEWDEPQGILAKLLLLDQFPRTVYRGTKEAFAQDETAASLSLEAISKDWDALGTNYTFAQRLFLYMPLMHSERLEAQDVCVEKTTLLHKEEAEAKGEPPKPNDFATSHRDVVAKFGRFPHRNAPLGRESTPEELEWLNSDDIPGWAKSQQASSEASE
ncbi:unnamed protein product [Ascophyllum nodosum]